MFTSDSERCGTAGDCDRLEGGREGGRRLLPASDMQARGPLAASPYTTVPGLFPRLLSVCARSIRKSLSFQDCFDADDCDRDRLLRSPPPPTRQPRHFLNCCATNKVESRDPRSIPRLCFAALRFERREEADHLSERTDERSRVADVRRLGRGKEARNGWSSIHTR